MTETAERIIQNHFSCGADKIEKTMEEIMELRRLTIKDKELITALFTDVFTNEPWNDDWSDTA